MKTILKGIGHFLLSIGIALAATLIILATLLWLCDDPILNLGTATDRKRAYEQIVAVFNSQQPSLLFATSVTLKRVLIAVGLSTLIGTIGGFWLCRGDKRWLWTQPALDFLRSTPATLWIGVAGVFFATGWLGYRPVVLAAVPCSLIMLFHVRHALAQEKPAHRHAFQLLTKNTSPWFLFLQFTFPLAVPAMLTGLRLIVSYSLVLIVVLEMCGAGDGDQLGLGDLGMKNLSNGWAAVAIAWFVGIVGFVLNKLAEFLEQFLIGRLEGSRETP